jgi:Phage P2 GpE
VVADVTWLYHWGPRDAGALTWTELAQWHAQAHRILRAQHDPRQERGDA